MKLDVTIESPVVDVSVRSPRGEIVLGSPVLREHVDTDPYTGSYTVTPTQETQTLYTDDLRMTDNVTINPIPSNYGLITWNGAVLTVT